MIAPQPEFVKEDFERFLKTHHDAIVMYTAELYTMGHHKAADRIANAPHTYGHYDRAAVQVIQKLLDEREHYA